jgi:hypothetical protein
MSLEAKIETLTAAIVALTERLTQTPTIENWSAEPAGTAAAKAAFAPATASRRR